MNNQPVQDFNKQKLEVAKNNLVTFLITHYKDQKKDILNFFSNEKLKKDIKTPLK